MKRIGAHVSTAGSVVNALTNAETIGANCLQIFAGSPRVWARKLYSSEEIEQFNSLADEHDLRPVFIHALYLVNLASDNQDLVEKSFQSLLMDLKNGQLIRSAGVIVHIGSHQGRGFEGVKGQIVEQIKRLLVETEKTPFLVENTACSQGKIGTLEEIAEIAEIISDRRLGICLDTAHLYEAGWDLKRPEVIEDLISKIRELNILDKIVCLHLNDSKTKLDSRHDVHANLGQGEIGEEGLKNLITRLEFAGLPLILEVPGQEKSGPDRENIDVAKRLAS